jgi:hypothetical protein
MDRMEQRLRALEDEREVVRIVFRAAHELDYGNDAAVFADLFTETGGFHASSKGPMAGPASSGHFGHDALQQFFLHHQDRGTPGHFTKHLLTNPNVVVDGDRATVDSYLVVLHENEDGPWLFAMGRHRDVLLRCPDGRWRFQDRHFEREVVHVKGQSAPRRP